MKRVVAVWLGIVGLLVLMHTAYAHPVDETVFYTTFSTIDGFRVWKIDAKYTGNGTAGNGTFSLLNDTGIANTPGSDGIALNPNNSHLLIGGQGNAVFQVNRTDGSFTKAIPNVSAFHLTVDSNEQIVWASGIPDGLASLPINPFGADGTVLPLIGDNTTITSLAFTPSHGVFYTTSGPSGNGDFGTIDLSTGMTTRILLKLPAAHGILFDPFGGDLILGGNTEIAQIDPANPSVVLSSRVVPGLTFDQGAVDGKGHIFWASNSGHFFFMDYSTTGLVASSNNFVSAPFLKDTLDDIAPLIGAGGTNQIVPEPSTWLLLATGLVGLLAFGWRRRQRAA